MPKKSKFRRVFTHKITKSFIALVVALSLLPMLFIVVMFPKPADNITYGVNFSSKYAKEIGLDWKKAYIQILDELKVKKLRVVAYWDEIEPKQGLRDFSDVKWQLEEARKRDAKVILAIGRKVPRFPECHEPKWWSSESEWGTKEDLLLAYISAGVTELKQFDNIEVWQVENEPHFPFGLCDKVPSDLIQREIKVVRSIDNRPVITQDSGEGGFWVPSYKQADYLGISMYRKVWFDFWGLVSRDRLTYFKYPISHGYYKIKADLLGIPAKNIIITELQGEPWGSKETTKLTTSEKNETMSPKDFTDTLEYSRKSGFSQIYVWGAEWWFWEKEHNNNSFYWETAKHLFD
ncbi:hypothetical protein A3K34_01785 [candidate division WWE3 bacterium RIFOXYC1_FULL_40_10]|uniref:Glycoside hydrolase family 42 N-terminal domain-containing protein n=1 Tax=candidate division WWE3 bacterium RIFOXYA2_FULL_46_9 TaxID=1802636 RepID=A0A1F4W2M5_UNCKA|nr:MAG: hypothetical protein A3K58_01785 [candidate division WWE3 bacterium RIFOXYB1_FULL_40_22]OGC61594.1 MAG: hypothetical protein A3K37_01785 [candidate division WWE3 bacterium RIFOXYA1_FULL_40_11]OGC63641.1 MAG: hypothetical protein A2264_04730 [candidate division WWE3 bacterium RIFOXYA2_FULL_46_9]OGC64728.1 MAG: hypothetical protein A2326_01665 [candidate division WWE3 bacterium RIFOXYB2_FULL_41_6]OGC65977.1 MAG: hypothetical protein A3K34_01785 [candidate division WWE3 bacterium RIFOXYC1_